MRGLGGRERENKRERKSRNEDEGGAAEADLESSEKGQQETLAHVRKRE